MAEQSNTDKSGAPPCGLYLRIPAGPDMVVECLVPDNAGRDIIEKAAAFVQMSQLSGIVAIINGPTKYAKMLEADGVLVSEIKDIKEAKESLGEDKIIGLSCGMKPEIADQALQAGADYIALGNPVAAPDVKTIAAFATKSDKPATVLGPLTNDTAGLYVMAGATFLDITHYLTTLEKGPAQATVNMLHAIDLALDDQKIN